jgi:hypothetical protein
MLYLAVWWLSLSYIFPETAGGEEGDHKMAAV